jgi:acyl transferase domain-containing protein/NADPH:quinone reductase-like Zn-dependent oxidoreductase/acyl carrier protein
LPGAPDLAAFARLLDEGRDTVTEIPADRWTHARFLHPGPGEIARIPHFRAGVIADPFHFDHQGFGISPREAVQMDPQQRLILTLAREALLDAGWREEAIAGQRIGTFIGASTTDWADLRRLDPAGGDRHMMTGGALSILANRLSNAFDLNGPAMTLDTACSSALVALDAACHAIAAGEAEAALVGGVNLLLSPLPFLGFWRAGMLSRRGHCQAFGAGCDGYVRAEGGVVLVLKPLARALAEGDAVRGVILATGVNAAGRTNGLSLPDRAAQARLIGEVLHRAHVSPPELGAFEAHGTGTPAGDPIEAAAIAEAVARHRARPLPIGSVKSNLGHTEAVAGLVGVLKALHMLADRRVPATLHAETANPAIPFAEYNLALATNALPLEGRGVAVNSFGFGGTNACAIVEAPPAHPAARLPRRPMPPLLLSARSGAALRDAARQWRAALDHLPAPRIAALLRGQARHRDLLRERLVLRGDLGAELDRFLAGETLPGRAQAADGQGIAFVFSGNGAVWPGMGREELRRSAAFRRGVAEADAALGPWLGRSPLRLLRHGVSEAELAGTDLAQPLLFAMQWGILRALEAEGIRPSLTLGHSVGEVAAAAAAGLLGLDQAARLIVARSLRQHETRGAGRMAALGAPPEAVGEILAGCSRPGEAPLEIAAINGPEALTIAGPEAALARLAGEAKAAGWPFLPLDLDYAFHSVAMEPVRAALLADLKYLRGRAPRRPMISSVTGEVLRRGDMRGTYWWRNLREPVRFDLAVRAAASRRPALFLEIGPNPILQGYLRAQLREAGLASAVLPSLRRHEGLAKDPFPRIADQATALGADPRGAGWFGGPALWRGLPQPLAEGESLRPSRTGEAIRQADPIEDHPLLGFRVGEATEEWTRSLDLTEQPWLADHRLFGDAVLSATAMLEMALAAGFLRHPETPAIEVADLRILRPLVLSAESSRELRSRLDAGGCFTLESRPRLAEGGWVLHAEARIAPLPALPARSAIGVTGETRSGVAIRQAAAMLGLHYGPAFHGLAACVPDQVAGRVLADLVRPDEAPPDAGLHLHPSRADGAIQALLGLAPGANTPAVPVRFARVVVRGGSAAVRAELTLEASGERSIEAGIVLRDAPGHAIAVMEGVTLQRLARDNEAPAAAAFRTDWVPAAPPPGWPEPPPSLAVAALDLASLGAPPAARIADAGLLAAAAMQGFAAEALRRPHPASPLAERLRHAVGADDLPEAAAIWRQAWMEAPELAADLAAIAAAGEALPRALTGQAVAPVAIPQGAAIRLLAERLATAAALLTENWPAARPLRVLILGAENGSLPMALAAQLAPALRMSGPGPRLVVAPLPGDDPKGLSAEVEQTPWDPAGEAPPPLVADLVLGLALTPRIGFGPRLAEGLRRAVAPGGALLLAEPEPDLFWDATRGLDPGWWGAPRLADGQSWAEALAAAGWQGVRHQRVQSMPWPATLLLAHEPPGATLFATAPARRFILVASGLGDALARSTAEALAAAGARITRRGFDEAGPAPRELHRATLVAMPMAVAELAPLARIAAAAEAGGARLAIATEGDSPVSAAAQAMGRVLANEAPALRMLRLAVEAGLAADMAGRLLASALLAQEMDEAEQRLTRDGRLVPRFAPGLPASPPAPGPHRLTIPQPGQLDRLRWEAAPEPATPGPGEVVVRIAASGLNFRDLMWAQGLLPEEALRHGFAGPRLGMECAGTVEAAGPGAPFGPGERVFGFAPGALATRALTRAEALAPIPEGVSFEAAATLPVAALTAIYALEECARIQPGERVLIHGGAGALGLASLQVALAAGARVAATAGSRERRALLRLAGAELVFDSRDLGFADELRAAWGGVDVALNSLSGAAMERTMGLMAPFGRFIELGKRDFAENRAVPLRPLRRNVTWFAVDVDEVARARPALAQRLLGEIARRLAEGQLRPLPAEVSPAAQTEAAFRALQSGGPIGKHIILPPPEAHGARHFAWPERPILVTGGAGGFGLEAACWLARQGVRRIALLSRRGAASPDAAEALARLAALGAVARHVAVDAADEAALRQALAAIRADWGPLGGVVHAANIYADGLASRLSARDLAAIWRAKVLAAEALDRSTREDPLTLFLLFSSAAVPLGSPGQAAYAAANAGIEAIARRRQAEGRPALAVQWGPVSDAGVLARSAAAAELPRRIGAEALPAGQLLDALPSLLTCGLAVAGVGRMSWGEARHALPLLGEPIFSGLANAPDEAAEGALLAQLAAAPAEQALALLRSAVAQEVGRILRLPPGAIPTDAPLQRLGLDSLGGVELRSGLERRFATDLPMVAVNDQLTVELLSRHLQAGLRPGAAE